MDQNNFFSKTPKLKNIVLSTTTDELKKSERRKIKQNITLGKRTITKHDEYFKCFFVFYFLKK